MLVMPRPRFTRLIPRERFGEDGLDHVTSYIALLRWGALRRSLGRFGMVGSIYRSTLVFLVSDYSDQTYRLGKALESFGSDDSR
jgi:hypothetical protein